MTSQQLHATGNKLATFQDPRKGSGGRWPKALKSGHRARRAQGMAVAKRYAGPLSLAAALLNPSQVNLFTQGFPPALAPCRRAPFFCSGAAFLFFQHVKLVGTDGAPREPQETFKRALRGLKKSPLINRFDPCSLILSSHSILQPQHHKSMSPLGVL